MTRRHWQRACVGTGIALACAVGMGIAQACSAAENDDAQEPATEEVAAIEAVIALHFQGLTEGDTAAFESAWDLSAGHVIHVSHGRTSVQPVEEAIAFWAESPAADFEGSIESIEVVGETIAHAHVQLAWHGGQYTDLLTLLKTRRGWRIVSKAYVAAEGSSLY